MRENSLSGSANLFKGANMLLKSALGGLEICAGSSYRGSICPMGAKIGSSYWEFREIEGSINRGLNPRDLRFGSKYRKVRETEGSRNWGSTVLIFLTAFHFQN